MVQYIGKLDKNKFKKITRNITTADVIITEKQIEHIKKRHPNNYEKYDMVLKEIINNPDYILRDSKPYTGILMRKIDTKNCFIMIIRLHTNKDNIEYKNSVITFF